MEFEINGQAYLAGKMNTFKQFHVSRRLVPAFGVAAAAISGEVKFEDLVQPIMQAIASMTDADCDFILDACLGVVKRRQHGDSWAPIYAGSSQSLMFDDIDMPTMLQIAGKVIQDNLSGFFPAKDAAASETPARPA